MMDQHAGADDGGGLAATPRSAAGVHFDGHRQGEEQQTRKKDALVVAEVDDEEHPARHDGDEDGDASTDEKGKRQTTAARQVEAVAVLVRRLWEETDHPDDEGEEAERRNCPWGVLAFVAPLLTHQSTRHHLHRLWIAR